MKIKKKNKYKVSCIWFVLLKLPLLFPHAPIQEMGNFLDSSSFSGSVSMHPHERGSFCALSSLKGGNCLNSD